jgi:hypothetical protein
LTAPHGPSSRTVLSVTALVIYSFMQPIAIAIGL